jgi:hydrogenase expression/formation protein HypE
MRSVLQLRTPEVADNNDQRSSLTSSVATLDEAQPRVRFKDPQIEMSHGAGGKASRRLVEGLFAPLLLSNSSERLADAVHIEINGATVAFTADSFVVRPLRFPGGSIGELAVNGTVNDLAVSGAKAHSMVVTFVLEEGLPSSVLEAEVRAMSDALNRAGVTMVGGDTKVVERGKADGMYITTAGIGTPIPGIHIDARTVRPGDKVLLSGPIGDHGITILLARADLDLEADLCSDTRSVLPMIQAMAVHAAPGIRWMRDPTRGGLATSLNELARDCGLSVELNEEEIPLRDEVRGACELLGLDPLHIANEGQFVAIVAPEFADIALNAIQLTQGGGEARIIGKIRTEPANTVVVNTRYGGSRIVDMLVGDPLPRIC